MSVEDAARCLGLEPADLRSEGRLASLGGSPPYALVELNGVAALQRCSPNATELERCGKVLAWTRAEAIGAFAADEARCRMFNARASKTRRPVPPTAACLACSQRRRRYRRGNLLAASRRALRWAGPPAAGRVRAGGPVAAPIAIMSNACQ